MVGLGRCGAGGAVGDYSSTGAKTGLVPLLQSCLGYIHRSQNWYEQREPDCLIKTKRSDRDYFSFTFRDFCPVLFSVTI